MVELGPPKVEMKMDDIGTGAVARAGGNGVEWVEKKEARRRRLISSSYHILPVTKKDADKVVVFLRKFFFRDEPLNVAVGLLDVPDSTCYQLEQYCLKCIPDGVSVMAISSCGDLLGVCLNGIITKGCGTDDDDDDDIEQEPWQQHQQRQQCQNTQQVTMESNANPKFGKILRLLTTVNKQANIFGHFPNAIKILDIRIVSVDDTCRGQGICKALIEKTREIARQINCSLIKVDCTSHYSAKAVSRLGFQCIYILPYEKYVNEDGRPIFTPCSPHNCATTYVMPLQVDYNNVC